MGALPANRFDCCCQSQPRVEVLQVSHDAHSEVGGRPVNSDAKNGSRDEGAMPLPTASMHCKSTESIETTGKCTDPKETLLVTREEISTRRHSKVEMLETNPEHVEGPIGNRSAHAAVNVDISISCKEPKLSGDENTPWKRTLRRTHTLISLASNEEDKHDVSMSVGVHSIQGDRGDMQDTFLNYVSEIGEFISVPRKTSSESSLDGKRKNVSFEESTVDQVDHCVDSRYFRGFFGVFDGHGGTDTSKFVESQIFEAFLQHCYCEPGPKTESEASAALRQAFLETEAAVLNLGRTREWMDGSTAAVVAVVEGHEGLLLVSGNVGDSEILLGRKNNDGSPDFVMMSELHNIKKNESERTRVKAAGGKICNNRLSHPKFNPRFCSLSVSRAFGDGFFKDVEFTDGRASGLTAEPYIVHRQISPLDRFLLLGCDGFFQEVGYLEVVESIFGMLESGMDPQSVSKAMVDLARQRGSKDNITVVLVLFTNFDSI